MFRGVAHRQIERRMGFAGAHRVSPTEITGRFLCCFLDTMHEELKRDVKDMLGWLTQENRPSPPEKRMFLAIVHLFTSELRKFHEGLPLKLYFHNISRIFIISVFIVR